MMDHKALLDNFENWIPLHYQGRIKLVQLWYMDYELGPHQLVVVMVKGEGYLTFASQQRIVDVKKAHSYAWYTKYG